jgi:uncharacterized membrane protein
MVNEKCAICSKEFPDSELIGGHGIRHELENSIRLDCPSWTDYSKICLADYSTYRDRYVQGMVEEEQGSVRNLESEVFRSIRDNEIVSQDVDADVQEKRGIGDRISDRVASFGGSWSFIIFFGVVLVVWIVVNTAVLVAKPFDPYPFILMNLILSCIAALQAPIIMMSQNRQEQKDRLRSENDYKVNLKSEIEIRTLHEKVDHLLLDQWSRMMKIQEIQIEMLNEIKNRSKD